MILRDADSPVCEDRAGFTTQRNRNIEKSCSIHHLEPMLRLVESLATKAERAKNDHRRVLSTSGSDLA